MQKVAGIATRLSIFFVLLASAKIQIVSAIAAIVKSQTNPEDAAFTCHACVIASKLQPFSINHETKKYIGCTAPQIAKIRNT